MTHARLSLLVVAAIALLPDLAPAQQPDPVRAQLVARRLAASGRTAPVTPRAAEPPRRAPDPHLFSVAGG